MSIDNIKHKHFDDDHEIGVKYNQNRNSLQLMKQIPFLTIWCLGNNSKEDGVSDQHKTADSSSSCRIASKRVAHAPSLLVVVRVVPEQ